MSTINFTFSQSGTLTDVSSAVLADPTNMFGVQRNDTSQTVVPANTAMTHLSLGTYAYAFTDPAPGLTYTAWVTYTFQGITNRQEITKLGPGQTPVNGYYAAQSDLEALFGITNIAVWSNLENSDASPPAANPARIQLALNFADAEINNFFRDGPYVVPLTLGPDSATIVRWGAVLAGFYLYTSRGQRDADEQMQKIANMARAAFADMSFYKSGIKHLTSARRWPAPTGPAAA